MRLMGVETTGKKRSLKDHEGERVWVSTTNSAGKLENSTDTCKRNQITRALRERDGDVAYPLREGVEEDRDRDGLRSLTRRFLALTTADRRMRQHDSGDSKLMSSRLMADVPAARRREIPLCLVLCSSQASMTRRGMWPRVSSGHAKVRHFHCC